MWLFFPHSLYIMIYAASACLKYGILTSEKPDFLRSDFSRKLNGFYMLLLASSYFSSVVPRPSQAFSSVTRKKFIAFSTSRTRRLASPIFFPLFSPIFSPFLFLALHRVFRRFSPPLLSLALRTGQTIHTPLLHPPL